MPGKYAKCFSCVISFNLHNNALSSPFWKTTWGNHYTERLGIVQGLPTDRRKLNSVGMCWWASLLSFLSHVFGSLFTHLSHWACGVRLDMSRWSPKEPQERERGVRSLGQIRNSGEKSSASQSLPPRVVEGVKSQGPKFLLPLLSPCPPQTTPLILSQNKAVKSLSTHTGN